MTKESPTGTTTSDHEWEVDELIDHIVNIHHGFIKNSAPLLLKEVQELDNEHGKKNPEFTKLANTFSRIVNDMLSHMSKEEQILFPFLKKLTIATDQDKEVDSPIFFALDRPINMMQLEHESANRDLEEIRMLTNSFNLPDAINSTWKACYLKLKEFDADLKRHFYLEDDVLFPMVLQIEKVQSRINSAT